MKLIFCPDCNDIFNVSFTSKSCTCGKCTAIAKDGLNMEYNNGIPLGIANSSFLKALGMATIENRYQKTPTECSGVEFTAFVLLDCTTTIKKIFH